MCSKHISRVCFLIFHLAAFIEYIWAYILYENTSSPFVRVAPVRQSSKLFISPPHLPVSSAISPYVLVYPYIYISDFGLYLVHLYTILDPLLFSRRLSVYHRLGRFSIV